MPKPKPKEETVRVNFTLPKSLKTKWEEFASKSKISVSQMVRNAVELRIQSDIRTTFKLIIAGEEKVMTKFQNNMSSYISKIQYPANNAVGAEFFIKDLRIDENNLCKLQIWIFHGEDRFKFLYPTYIKGASGALLLHNITEKETLKDFDKWLDILRSDYPLIPIMLVGIDGNLKNKREIPLNETLELAKKNKLKGYVDITPETGENIQILFETITRFMNDAYESKVYTF